MPRNAKALPGLSGGHHTSPFPVGGLKDLNCRNPIHYPHPCNRNPVKTDMGQRAHSSHLASPPRLRAFLGLRALGGLASLFPPIKTVNTRSFISPGRDAPSTRPTPFFSFPFTLRFFSTFFHPSSVSLWRSAGPVAVAGVDGAGCV